MKVNPIKAKLIIPEGVDMDNVSVYLDLQPYILSNSETIIQMGTLQTGAHSLMVSYCDEFGQQNYTDISFYVCEKVWETGTFY